MTRPPHIDPHTDPHTDPHPDPLHARAADFVTRLVGRDVASIADVPAGLGTRRFLRVAFATGEPATLIARIDDDTPPAPGAPAPEPPLEPIRSLFEANGLPVPRRYGADPAAGIELLEDLGDVSLERAAHDATPERRRALYGRAVSLIPAIQSITASASPVAAFERRLDAALIATKAKKWLEWTIPFARGRAASDAERDATERAFAITRAACEAAPARLAHRDYKAANLHLVPDPAGGEPRLVMIDLQGAFLAPPEYDLVCLLRDSHVPLPQAEIDVHLAGVRPHLPDAPAADDFTRRFDLLTLVRVAKDISHYVDAAIRRGDRRYLPLLATGVGNLSVAAERASRRDAAVAPFAELVAELRPVLIERARPGREGGPRCAP